MRKVFWSGLVSLALVAGGIGVAIQPAGAVDSHANYRAVCPGPAFSSARCDAYVVTDGSGHPLASQSWTSGYGASQLASAYNWPDPTTSSITLGSGPTVAIVDAYDNPNAAADLAAYRIGVGLPVCSDGT